MRRGEMRREEKRREDLASLPYAGPHFYLK
jgi:hypothetical protein